VMTAPPLRSPIPTPPEIAFLNALSRRPGLPALFSPTVARPHPSGGGRWLLMNRREDGWASGCRLYGSLAELVRAWDVDIAGVGVDGVSEYVEVRNRNIGKEGDQ